MFRRSIFPVFHVIVSQPVIERAIPVVGIGSGPFSLYGRTSKKSVFAKKLIMIFYPSLDHARLCVIGGVPPYMVAEFPLAVGHIHVAHHRHLPKLIEAEQ